MHGFLTARLFSPELKPKEKKLKRTTTQMPESGVKSLKSSKSFKSSNSTKSSKSSKSKLMCP